MGNHDVRRGTHEGARPAARSARRGAVYTSRRWARSFLVPATTRADPAPLGSNGVPTMTGASEKGGVSRSSRVLAFVTRGVSGDRPYCGSPRLGGRRRIGLRCCTEASSASVAVVRSVAPRREAGIRVLACARIGFGVAPSRTSTGGAAAPRTPRPPGPARRCASLDRCSLFHGRHAAPTRPTAVLGRAHEGGRRGLWLDKAGAFMQSSLGINCINCPVPESFGGRRRTSRSGDPNVRGSTVHGWIGPRR